MYRCWVNEDERVDPRLIVLGLDPNLTREEAVEELTNRVVKRLEEEYGIVLADETSGGDSQADDAAHDG